MVQGVSHAPCLRAHVLRVVLVRSMLDRYLGAHRQPVALQAKDLLRVVRKDPDRGEPEVGEDLRADPVVAQVGWQPKALVGFDRVKAVLLQAIGAQLVEQANASPLLGEVEQDSFALALDHRKR